MGKVEQKGASVRIESPAEMIARLGKPSIGSSPSAFDNLDEIPLWLKRKPKPSGTS